MKIPTPDIIIHKSRSVPSIFVSIKYNWQNEPLFTFCTEKSISVDVLQSLPSKSQRSLKKTNDGNHRTRCKEKENPIQMSKQAVSLAALCHELSPNIVFSRRLKAKNLKWNLWSPKALILFTLYRFQPMMKVPVCRVNVNNFVLELFARATSKFRVKAE